MDERHLSIPQSINFEDLSTILKVSVYSGVDFTSSFSIVTL
jgi:hypothetical protein